MITPTSLGLMLSSTFSARYVSDSRQYRIKHGDRSVALSFIVQPNNVTFESSVAEITLYQRMLDKERNGRVPFERLDVIQAEGRSVGDVRTWIVGALIALDFGTTSHEL